MRPAGQHRRPPLTPPADPPMPDRVNAGVQRMQQSYLRPVIDRVGIEAHGQQLCTRHRHLAAAPPTPRSSAPPSAEGPLLPVYPARSGPRRDSDGFGDPPYGQRGPRRRVGAARMGARSCPLCPGSVEGGGDDPPRGSRSADAAAGARQAGAGRLGARVLPHRRLQRRRLRDRDHAAGPQLDVPAHRGRTSGSDLADQLASRPGRLRAQLRGDRPLLGHPPPLLRRGHRLRRPPDALNLLYLA